eukprot:32748_1
MSKEGEQCPLYREKIANIVKKAASIAFTKGDLLHPSDFSEFDNLHYLGSKSLDDFAKQIGLCTGQRVIDIGAGVGGPARHLVTCFPGVKVTCIEYRESLATAGKILNRLSLNRPADVEYVTGDFTRLDLKSLHLERTFDALMSQLCFCHIADKEILLKQCATVLKPNAHFFVEDFFRLGDCDSTASDQHLLDHQITAAPIPTRNEWESFMVKSGLVVDAWIDESERWTDFCWQRYDTFLSSKDTLIAQQGEQCFVELDGMYGAMTVLLRGDTESEYARLCSRYRHVADSHTRREIHWSKPAMRGFRVIAHLEA